MSQRAKEPAATIAGAQASALSLAKTRLLIVMGVFFLGYLAITLRLIDLTLLRNPHAAEIEAQKAALEKGGEAAPQAVKKAALRGTIVDRNGELMATSLKMASVYADATQVVDAKAAARDLAAILPDQKEADIEKKLSSGRKFVWIARNITPRQEYAINNLGHPGISFEHAARRIYPHARLTAHLLGYTDVDGRGISGIEKSFDRQLAEGEEDVKLTIDLRIQHVMHKELKKAMETFSAKAAIGMAMDVNTGEIIAMVSLPDFDPHHPMDSSADARFNRNTLGVFEMGSTFKLFSTAAALDAGKVTFATQIDAITPIKVGRFTINDYHAKRRIMSVPEVFIYSSNIGTGKMALMLGDGGLREFYEKLGFLELPPIDLPERGKPIYPKVWRDASTLTASFGHGIAVSPLHLMRATSALVNGGILVKPRITRPAGDAPLSMEPEGERVIKPQTSTQIRQLLELVVADGTGSKAYVEGYDVGGKTGTAEKISARGYNKSALFSSFLGVFPINNPRYAVVAILDEPQGIKETYGYATGGWTAAPVVQKVIAQMGPLYQIPPDLDSTRDIVAEMAPYLKEVKRKGNNLASSGNN